MLYLRSVNTLKRRTLSAGACRILLSTKISPEASTNWCRFSSATRFAVIARRVMEIDPPIIDPAAFGPRGKRAGEAKRANLAEGLVRVAAVGREGYTGSKIGSAFRTEAGQLLK